MLGAAFFVHFVLLLGVFFGREWGKGRDTLHALRLVGMTVGGSKSGNTPSTAKAVPLLPLEKAFTLCFSFMQENTLEIFYYLFGLFH